MTISLQKIKKISEPNFTKSKQKVRFGQYFLKMILSMSATKKMPSGKQFYGWIRWINTQNGDQNLISPSS